MNILEPNVMLEFSAKWENVRSTEQQSNKFERVRERERAVEQKKEQKRSSQFRPIICRYLNFYLSNNKRHFLSFIYI